MRNLERIIKHFAAFAGALLVLWLLLFLSALIPNAMLQDNMERSAWYYSQRDAFEYTQEGKLHALADHYADAIWLNISWNMGLKDPFQGSVLTCYYDGEDWGESVGLYLTLTEGIPPNVDYTRYWHGTAMFIRVLSLITTVAGIKLVGFAVILLLALVTLIFLSRRGHIDLAAILALCLLLVRVWELRLSMEYQPAFIIAFAVVPVYLIVERRKASWLTFLSVICGVTIAFFDFLTTETVTILLPLILVIAVRAKEGRLGECRESCGLVLKCLLSWGCAYVGTFLVKWTAASVISGSNAFAAALTSVGERMNGSLEEFGERSASFLSAPLANLTMLFGGENRVDGKLLLIGLGISLLLLLSVWYLFRTENRYGCAGVLLACLGGIVLVRYLVLYNHSYLHCFFTYRALVSFLLGVLVAVRLRVVLPSKKTGGRRT